MKISHFFLFVLILFGLQDCLSIGQSVGPTHGILFTRNHFPGEFNANNDVKPEVKAEGCVIRINYIFVLGDASAGSIAKRNGIKRIATIDHRTESALWFFSTYCTIIRGEK